MTDTTTSGELAVSPVASISNTASTASKRIDADTAAAFDELTRDLYNFAGGRHFAHRLEKILNAHELAVSHSVPTSIAAIPNDAVRAVIRDINSDSGEGWRASDEESYWAEIMQAAGLTPPAKAIEESAPKSDVPSICWSADEENFSSESLAELVSNESLELKPGATVWFGQPVELKTSELCDAEDVIDMISERAHALVGELADNYPDVSQQEKSELEGFLKSWVSKVCPPPFSKVENIQSHVLTEAELANPLVPKRRNPTIFTPE